MIKAPHQPFHLVEESPWPILLPLPLLSLILCLLSSLFGHQILPIVWGGNVLLLLMILYAWGKNVSSEGVSEGSHPLEVEGAMKMSMGWFITSEVFFFFAFFFAFFSFSLTSFVEGGASWPPLFLSPMDAFAIPLLNTIILVSSGVSLTWAHHSLLSSSWKESLFGVGVTISLGVYFTLLQLLEYSSSLFSMNDSSYGSIFFLATGFHGFHVLLGTSLLVLAMKSIMNNESTTNHHVLVETSSWYWHFVDVVWLFLFCCMYWWGS